MFKSPNERRRALSSGDFTHTIRVVYGNNWRNLVLIETFFKCENNDIDFMVSLYRDELQYKKYKILRIYVDELRYDGKVGVTSVYDRGKELKQKTEIKTTSIWS